MNRRPAQNDGLLYGLAAVWGSSVAIAVIGWYVGWF